MHAHGSGGSSAQSTFSAVSTSGGGFAGASTMRIGGKSAGAVACATEPAAGPAPL